MIDPGRRLLVLPVCAALIASASHVLAQTVSVTATVETAPVPTSGDAADDAAIWIHPSQPQQSLIIGTDKTGGGLAVYDLAGVQRQYYSSVKPNNVDLRYNFPLGSASVGLVGFSNKNGNRIGVFRVDAANRTLVNVEARQITVGFNVYGFCMYRSPDTGDTYAFISDTAGKVEQWRLFDNGAGKVDGTRVRTLTVGSVSEGCVADDVHRALYIAEENVAIWRYGAEPGDGSARTRVDTTGSGGHVRADVEGLTIYYTSSGDGYLIASSQGVNEFVVYDRAGVNAYRATFKIASGGIDGVTGTDGIDVTNFPLGSSFAEGVFVAQDGTNTGANQNFKLVPWGSIARAVSPDLTIDTTWDPRHAEGGNGTNTPPSVNAGPNQTITLPASANLDGTVSDDGQPGPLTTTWSKVSGPGSVSFGNASLVDTTASFSTSGSYTLRLTANDGALSASDNVAVTVNSAGSSSTFEKRVASSSDDAEQFVSSGAVSLASSDLEMTLESSNQVVGLRFTGVTIPKGAAIVNAWVRFKADETGSTATSLNIRGQAADNPATFTTSANNISARPGTTAAVNWAPAAWTVVGQAGSAQQTPNLSAVIQEVVTRSGWASGNSLVLIITGTGKRTAESYNGDQAGAALLHVEYQ
jgi:3-phytase